MLWIQKYNDLFKHNNGLQKITENHKEEKRYNRKTIMQYKYKIEIPSYQLENSSYPLEISAYPHEL